MRQHKQLYIDSDYQQGPPQFSMLSCNTPQQLTFDSRPIKSTHSTQRFMRQDITEYPTFKRLKTTQPMKRQEEVVFKNRLIQRQLKRKAKVNILMQPQSLDFKRFNQENYSTVPLNRNKKKMPSFKFLFQKNNILEQKIKAQKIKNIQHKFINKLSRSCTNSVPVDLTAFEYNVEDTLLNSKGIQLPVILENIINLVSIILIFSLIVIYTISLVFENITGQGSVLSYVQIGGLCFYIIEMVLGLVSIRYEGGKKIEVIRQIVLFYASRGLWVDLVSISILIIDVSSNFIVIHYFRLFIIFKLPQCFQKIEKLEVYFIQNIYNEQYWQLIKVILFNFCYAHIIALFLASMASLQTNNWMTLKQLNDVPWAEKYVWSFYWATNIMLTVGFGDIAATNTRQAICLIIIETFSCIVMAYNVNCMGTIITKIRSQDQLRRKKFKVFKKLTDNSHLPDQLTYQINNYIEESSNLRKNFNYEEEKQFVNDLPITLKTNFLKQSNHLILKDLLFFKNLLDKTVYRLAQFLQTKISHPQEVIRAIDDDFDLIILKKGEIGYTCKKSDNKFSEKILDLIKVKDNEKPFLTSLDFLSKKKPLYEIKSLTFSVIYMMQYNSFISVFRQNDLDYQYYCFLRDKIRGIPDQFQVYPCEFCHKFNHFKFTCPKLHYVPLEQHIINKEIYRQKTQKSQRRPIKRIKAKLIKPIDFYRKVNSYVKTKTPKQKGKKKINDSKMKKNSNIESDELKNVDVEAVQLNLIKDVSIFMMMENANIQTTKELIELQFLKGKKQELYNDEIWILKLDEMKDYYSYFTSHNPSALAEKFDPKKRIKKDKEEDEENESTQSINKFCQTAIL